MNYNFRYLQGQHDQAASTAVYPSACFYVLGMCILMDTTSTVSSSPSCSFITTRVTLVSCPLLQVIVFIGYNMRMHEKLREFCLRGAELTCHTITCTMCSWNNTSHVSPPFLFNLGMSLYKGASQTEYSQANAHCFTIMSKTVILYHMIRTVNSTHYISLQRV